MEQYQNRYMHAIDDVKKIKLRNRDVSMNKGMLNPNQTSISQMNTEKETKNKRNLLNIKRLKIKVRK